MKILVIGGTGFLGRRLLPKLLRFQHRLTVLTRDPEKVPELDRMGVSVTLGDVLDPGKFVGSLARQDLVVFMARPPFKPGRMSIKTFNALRVITAGFVANAVILAENFGCPLLLTSGTSFRTEGDDIADETRPIERFGMARIGEDYDRLVAAARARGSPPLIEILPGQIYGPGGLFMTMVKLARRGRGVFLGAGRNRIPRIHVEDCAEAFARAIEHLPIGERFIVADDYPCTSREFSDYLAELLCAPRPKAVPEFIFKLLAGKLAYETLAMDCRVSNAKAKRMLGWNLKYPTYREGLRATVEEIEKTG